MKKQTVQLGGKTWTVQQSSKPLVDSYGYCDMPNKRIVLCRTLTPEQKKEWFFHEGLHGLFWFLDEDVVKAAGRELHDSAEELDFD